MISSQILIISNEYVSHNQVICMFEKHAFTLEKSVLLIIYQNLESAIKFCTKILILMEFPN